MEKKEKKYGVFEKKFNEKLEKSSRVFTLIGLVLTLFLVYSFIDYESVKKTVAFTEPSFEIDENIDYRSEVFKKELVKKKVVEKIVEEPISKPTKENFTKLDVKEDDFKIIETESKPNPSLDLNKIVEIDVDDTVVEETVPFIAVEHVPVFPGCKGSKAELIDCFSKKMRKHINRKFDNQLGEELGLSSGVKKIYVMFKIGKNGEVEEIRSSAPHPKLSEEAERIMKLLPTMTPARQGTVKVGVSYSIPIVFEIQ